MISSYQIEGYLASKGLKLRRRAQKAELFICPFCEGGEHKDRWTCVVYFDGGNFTCMRGSCDVRGTFWALLEKFGDDPKDYYKKERETGKPVITFVSKSVEPYKLTDEALAYLLQRGLRKDAFDDISVWCDERGRINFGYYHEGQLCMVKVREPRKPKEGEPKATQAWKGGLRTLWGIEQCDPKHGYLIITFGEYDRIALRQADLNNVVSVPCGDSDLEWINICWDDLSKYDTIILWCDNDESGKKCLAKISERLDKQKLRVVKSTYKDANEMLVYRSREVGADEAEKEMFALVGEADWVWRGDLVQVSDIEQEEISFEGFNTGFKFLDTTLGGFLFNRLTVHTGNSKSGKSTALLTTAASAIEQGGVVCIWTGEDTAQDYKYNMQVHLAGYEGIEIRTSHRTGRTYSYVQSEYRNRIDEWLREKLFLLNVRIGVTEDRIMENFELAYKRYGCNVFILDNLMKVVASKGTEHPFQRQAQITDMFSNFVKDHRAHGHMVAHQRKGGDVTKDAVSGAKEITNIADSVISWQRIPEDKKAEHNNADTVCEVLANRVFGDEGTVNLRYYHPTKRFGEGNADLMKVYPI